MTFQENPGEVDCNHHWKSDGLQKILWWGLGIQLQENKGQWQTVRLFGPSHIPLTFGTLVNHLFFQAETALKWQFY